MVSKKKNRSAKGNHLKKDVSMLALLANANTHNCRLLLKKLGVQDATNHLDLELKLAEMYKEAPDKIVIEKQFAEIHPHKDFILKHLAPKVEPKDESIIEVIDPDVQGEKAMNSDSFISEDFHNASGERNSCSCGMCASGFSGIDGAASNRNSTTDLTIIGLVSVIALFGMVLIAKK